MVCYEAHLDYEPHNIPSEVKAALKNGYVTGVVCISGYDPPKGVR